MYIIPGRNTEKTARELAKAKKADIVRIETVKPYEGSYNDVAAQGQREVEEGYKPAVRPPGKNISDYDIIAVGTPAWWYTMAPAVETFLEDNDFSGKTVIPFMTNGGWPGHVIADMTAAVTGAEVKCPMQIQFDSTGGDKQVTPRKKVDEWIRSIG